MAWHKHEDCTYRIPSVNSTDGHVKLAAFDLDSTLIVSDRGEPYATKGWILAYANTVEVLREFHTQGFTVVIFSNRSGPPYMLTAAQRRIEELEAQVRVPLNCFFATSRRKDGIYRKPQPGMMALFASLCRIVIYDVNSFYSGDAIGSTSSNPWFRWSDDDSNFAKACGLPFKSPDTIFASFPRPQIPPNVRLIITIGQHGSGVESNLTYAGQIIELTPTSQLVVLTDEHIAHPETIPTRKPTSIYYAIGFHPTHAEREHIRQILDINPDQVAYHVYAWPSYDKSLSSPEYSRLLQLPPDFVRCN